MLRKEVEGCWTGFGAGLKLKWIHGRGMGEYIHKGQMFCTLTFCTLGLSTCYCCHKMNLLSNTITNIDVIMTKKILSQCT